MSRVAPHPSSQEGQQDLHRQKFYLPIQSPKGCWGRLDFTARSSRHLLATVSVIEGQNTACVAMPWHEQLLTSLQPSEKTLPDTEMTCARRSPHAITMAASSRRESRRHESSRSVVPIDVRSRLRLRVRVAFALFGVTSAWCASLCHRFTPAYGVSNLDNHRQLLRINEGRTATITPGCFPSLHGELMNNRGVKG